MNVSFEGNLKNASMKAGELASIGKMNAEFKGQGVVLAWQGLFPGPGKPATPAEIGVAWQAVKLEATLEIEGGEFRAEEPGRASRSRGSAGAGASATAAGSAGSGAPPPISASLR